MDHNPTPWFARTPFAVFGAVVLVFFVTSIFVAMGRREDPPEGNPVAGKKVFMANCVICHGVDGKGDGPAAAALNPKPMNFTDAARMSKISQATRLKAVREGGAAVGVSPAMPTFKEVLTPKQIRDVLAYVRTFLGKAPGPGASR